MDNTILLKMDDDKRIQIFLNGNEKYTIEPEDRSITAKAIYDILCYSEGYTYRVEIENDKNHDVAVLDFFHKQLLQPIIEEINNLPSHENKYVSDDEEGHD